MATKFLIEILKLFTVSFLISITALGIPIGSAEILIQGPGLTENEFSDFLGAHTEFKSYKSVIIEKTNYLDYSLVKLFSNWTDEIDANRKITLQDGILDNLASGFLSAQKRELWKELYLKVPLNKVHNNDLEQQVKILTDKSNLTKLDRGRKYLNLGDIEIDTTSDLFVNGWLIDPTEKNQIILDTKLKYHFFIASNSKREISLITVPKRMKLIQDNLILGSCENSSLNPNTKDLDQVAFGLFPKNCITDLSESKNNFVQTDSTPKLKTETGNKWGQSKLLYGLLIIGSIIALNELQHYDIKLSF
jgi:hypothetical protein